MTATEQQHRIVRMALVLNALMCLIGLGAGVYAHSSSILADAVDMAADASGYALTLLAMRHGRHWRALAARWAGGILVLLGIAIIGGSIFRWIHGSAPHGPVMMGYSVLSLAVNIFVLARLSRIREGGVHLNASYLCTRADVLANLGVFASGTIILLTGAYWVDLIGGMAISLLIFNEAREIFEQVEEQGGASGHG